MKLIYDEKEAKFQIRRNLLKLNVYLDSKIVKVVDESPKVTFISLLSSIGGILGLFGILEFSKKIKYF